MASVRQSRIKTSLEIFRCMNKEVPDRFLEEIFVSGDPQLKLNVVQLMLSSGNKHAFKKLQACIDSQNKILSSGAQKMLERIMDPA